MLQFVLKSKLTFCLVLFISLVYFILRLPNLTLQPIFADEAIYIRWAQVMRAEPTLRFLPLSDGKTPLFMWAMIPLFKIFKDPLFAGRFLSVISGYITFLGVLFLGWRIFNRKVGLWAGFFMAITPFIVFFDRMALVDSMLSAFSIWSLNLALLLIQYQRIDLAMALGYSLGGGLLTKTPALFNIMSLPATLLALHWRSAKLKSKLFKMLGLWLIVLIITFAIYNILRLGPGFNNLNSRNQDYVFSPYELKGRMLDPFIPHFRDLTDIFPKFLTWPMLILIFAGITLAFSKKNFPALVVFTWSLIPLLIQMAFLKTFTARYLLPSIAPLLCLAAYSMANLTAVFKINKFFLTLFLLVLISAWPIFIDYHFLTNTAQALLPASEKGYWKSWTAGYNLKEIAAFFDQQSEKNLVIVGTQGSFGTLPDGLQIYLDTNRQVVIIGGGSAIDNGLRKAAEKNQTYFVANRSYNVGIEEGLTLIRDYPKFSLNGKPEEAIFLFRVSPVVKK